MLKTIPNISLVLNRFYSLGNVFTYDGITDFIKKIIADEEVKQKCQSWIFSYTVQESFIELLYGIGFFGICNDNQEYEFRSLGARSTTAPKITRSTRVKIHPSYRPALNLHSEVINSLGKEVLLKTGGLVEDLPEGVTLDDYHKQLMQLKEELATNPMGQRGANEFENIVGSIIRLCFFNSLTNVEKKVYTHVGTQIRDYICSNTAKSGFWEMIRNRYDATQIVWECKNTKDIESEDFHQAEYYMNENIGRFVVIAYRGTMNTRYYNHITNIAKNKKGLVILLGQRDLEVFVRQACNGKHRDSHIQDIYDTIVRKIS